MQRAERGEELTIGFFGGSITQGKILKPLTNLVSSFAMGTTVLLGQQIGCGERKKGCRTDFADIQNKKECGGNRQWQNHYLRNWAANTKGKGII